MVRSSIRSTILLHSLAALLVAGLSSTSQAESVLLVFSSPHCGPCQQLKPTLHQLEQEGYPLRHIDVTRERQLAQQFRVDRVPTLIMLADGREVDRQQGARSHGELQQMFATVGVQPAVRHGVKASAPTLLPSSHTPVSAAPFTASPRGSNSGARVHPASFEKSLLDVTVRISVEDATGRSYGTGTLIDTREGDALIVTCGHLFRGDSAQGKITIEIFESTPTGLRMIEQLPGKLESYDLDRDVGLLSIRPRTQVKVARVAAAFGERVNDRIWSVGCDRGADPTVRSSRVTAIDRYQGPPNIEAAGAPVEGRSGGGLFNVQGELVGVCFAADNEGDEGLYSGLASVHAEIDNLGMQSIYAPSTNTQLASPQASPFSATPSRMALLPSRIIRGQNPNVQNLLPVATPPPASTPSAFPNSPPAKFPTAPLDRVEPSSIGSLPSVERAALIEIARRATQSEVVVIIRPREPGGASEIIKLDQVSPEFVEALRMAK